MSSPGTGGRSALVVGGFGALGTVIATQLGRDGFDVLRSDLDPHPELGGIVLDSAESFAALPVLEAVVWAQGLNVNDRADAHNEGDLARLLDTNVTLVAEQLEALVTAGRLVHGSRVVVISSIWQEIARPGKFSYTVSKAAVGGLVRAAAMDLAPRGILVNGVLPGVVDTPMTRAMLSAGQVADVEAATPAGRMVRPEDVAGLVAHLVSPANGGVTGQSIVVDLGYSIGRVL